jgi:hypothetical protein
MKTAMFASSQETSIRIGSCKTMNFRVTEINNSKRLRRIWARLQGTSSGAYRDMCRCM